MAQSARWKVCLTYTVLCAFGNLSAAGDEPGINWDSGVQGHFITSLAADSKGNIWVGTEDFGVWRYGGTGRRPGWRRFATTNGLGDDNAYAIAADHVGRVWVGHLNHGVSVFDGRAWQNYPKGDGPLSERVYDIAVSPRDGDVWIAGNAALTRYSETHDNWHNYTRRDGLPADNISAIAFDAQGNLIVGFQSAGLATAQAEGDFSEWHHVTGPGSAPNRPAGAGLPTSLINDVVVSRQNVVYVATPSGLAFRDGTDGAWRFVRGIDWLAKSAQQAAEDATIPDYVLKEDYVTCLALADSDRMYVGYRQSGFELVDIRQATPRSIRVSDKLGDYAKSILYVPHRPTLIGRYGTGLAQDEMPQAAARQLPNNTARKTRSAPHPSPAVAPSLDKLNALLQQLGDAPRGHDQIGSTVLAVADDWQTQGDWIGRYGRYWACICGICVPKDYHWGAGPQPVEYHARIGPNHRVGDSLRYYVHQLYNQNPHTLEMPPTYYDSRVKKGLTAPGMTRREAEWCDNGQSYPLHHHGPDIYCSLKVPEGLFHLALYFYNKDGHQGRNRLRDYRISIRQHPADQPLHSIDGFAATVELANGRVRDFWGGVYKRFLVRGPIELTVKVERHHSHNATMSGVFLDEIEEFAPPYFDPEDSWEKIARRRHERRAQLLAVTDAEHRARFQELDSEGAAVDRLMQELEDLPLWNPRIWARDKRHYYAALRRWCRAQLTADPRSAKSGKLLNWLATCEFQMGNYVEWETLLRRRLVFPPRDIEKQLMWDSQTYSYMGKGFQIVNEYLKQLDDAEKQTVVDIALRDGTQVRGTVQNGPLMLETSTLGDIPLRLLLLSSASVNDQPGHLTVVLRDSRTIEGRLKTRIVQLDGGGQQYNIPVNQMRSLRVRDSD